MLGAEFIPQALKPRPRWMEHRWHSFAYVVVQTDVKTIKAIGGGVAPSARLLLCGEVRQLTRKEMNNDQKDSQTPERAKNNEHRCRSLSHCTACDASRDRYRPTETASHERRHDRHTHRSIRGLYRCRAITGTASANDILAGRRGCTVVRTSHRQVFNVQHITNQFGGRTCLTNGCCRQTRTR